MINGRRPDRRLICVRRRRKSNVCRYLIIAIIALVLLAVSVALAYWMDSPAPSDKASLSNQSTGEVGVLNATRTTPTTTTSTSAATSTTSTTATTLTTTIKAIPVGDEYFKDALSEIPGHRVL